MTKRKFEIWYMRPEWFRNGICGGEPNAAALEETHIHLKDVEIEYHPDKENLFELEDQLEQVWEKMQGFRWSPNGEARELLRIKGLEHTSMSKGDVIRVSITDSTALTTYLVADTGFKAI